MERTRGLHHWGLIALEVAGGGLLDTAVMLKKLGVGARLPSLTAVTVTLIVAVLTFHSWGVMVDRVEVVNDLSRGMTEDHVKVRLNGVGGRLDREIEGLLVFGFDWPPTRLHVEVRFVDGLLSDYQLSRGSEGAVGPPLDWSPLKPSVLVSVLVGLFVALPLYVGAAFLAKRNPNEVDLSHVAYGICVIVSALLMLILNSKTGFYFK